MKNFRNYTPEKYGGPEYLAAEERIYLAKNPSPIRHPPVMNTGSSIIIE